MMMAWQMDMVVEIAMTTYYMTLRDDDDVNNAKSVFFVVVLLNRENCDVAADGYGRRDWHDVHDVVRDDDDVNSGVLYTYYIQYMHRENDDVADGYGRHDDDFYMMYLSCVTQDGDDSSFLGRNVRG